MVIVVILLFAIVVIIIIIIFIYLSFIFKIKLLQTLIRRQALIQNQFIRSIHAFSNYKFTNHSFILHVCLPHLGKFARFPPTWSRKRSSSTNTALPVHWRKVRVQPQRFWSHWGSGREVRLDTVQRHRTTRLLSEEGAMTCAWWWVHDIYLLLSMWYFF